MATFIPHTDEEVDGMLAFLGLGSVEELFAAVPAALRLAAGLDIPDGVTEPDVLAAMAGLGERNRARSDRLVCFAGGGAYDHEIPAVVPALAGRSEFVTSYTPYQPEVAQGVLQAVFEFQTMVARLAGLPIANASLYDGASALVEAVNLGVAAAGSPEVWVSAGRPPALAPGAQYLRPRYRSRAHGGRARGRGDRRGRRRPGPGRPGVVVVGDPNYLGCIEDLAAARRLCDRSGGVLVVGADPVSAGILRAPGELGADVVVGEGQPFGTALGFGGRTSACSPVRTPTSGGSRAGWWARPWTPRGAPPT